MAPVFQAVGTAQSGVGALTVAWPTHLTNDIGILVIETGGEGTTVSITAPSGWVAITGSPVTDVATAAGSKLQVWWKRAASGAETSVTVPDSGDHQVAAIYTFRGCITTGNPWNAVTTGIKAAASTTATTPDLTTSVTDTLYVAIVGRPDDSASTTHFGTLTNANLTGIASAGEAGTTSGHGGGFVLQYGTFAGVGATGTSTLTKAASTADTYMVLALASKAGLQAEPGRYFLPERNLRLWSEAFDNAVWTKTNASIIANATTAPDGTLTADALIENTTQSVTHDVRRNITFISGRTYTASCYFKLYPGPITRQARLGLGTNAAFPVDTHITINLATGAISATQGSPSATSITNEGNGWYRASLTKQYTGAGVTAPASIILVNTAGTQLYTDADGLSGVYIWGAQYEEGSLSAYDPVGPAAAAITNTTVTRRLVADPGAFTLTGQPAALLKSDLLIGATGSFTLTGNAADLVRDARLTAATGAFTETGNVATLRVTRSLLSAAGAFTLSGQSAGFQGQRYLPLAPGAFAATGNAATFRVTHRLAAAAGSIALTGNDAALFKSGLISIPAEPGAYTLAGNAATLRHGYQLVATAGAATVTGSAATLLRTVRLAAAPATFIVSGQSAGFLGQRYMPLAPGAFALTGQPADLRFNRRLQGSSATFLATGPSVYLRPAYTRRRVVIF